MFNRKDDSPISGSREAKVSINPSYEWDEDAKALNVSHRELEVFALLVDGHDNKEIAQILGIQYQSVKNHVSSLYRKLKAKNMAQAMKLLLFGNFIKVEVVGEDWWVSEFDKEKWMKYTQWLLDPSNSQVSEKERNQTKKFLLEFGLYGKLYDERLKELRKSENGDNRE
jgi:DNA-binding CsgD family transcriptional regulator